MVSRKPALSEAEGDLLLHFLTYATSFEDTAQELESKKERIAKSGSIHGGDLCLDAEIF